MGIVIHKVMDSLSMPSLSMCACVRMIAGHVLSTCHAHDMPPPLEVSNDPVTTGQLYNYLF